MTDRMGPYSAQGAHRQHREVAVPRRTLLLVLAIVAPALAAGCGGRAADAVTTLRTDGPGVQVVAGGHSRPAVDGERLPVGTTVRTAGAGAALLTGGRITTLGPRSEVVVAGRSQYVLDDGTVVLDRRAGPDATLVAGPVSIGDVGRTSVRVERGFAVRVAVFDGGSAEVTAGASSLAVPALHEADIAGSQLPTSATPLSLRDDALDVVASPALVSLDRALNSGAAQVDAPAGAQAAVRFAQRTTTVVPAADVSTGALADRVLPASMAGAVGGDVSRTYAAAVALRAAGGSWGVVAELVGARLPAIRREMALLLAPQTAGAPVSGVLGGSSGSAVTAEGSDAQQSGSAGGASGTTSGSRASSGSAGGGGTPVGTASGAAPGTPTGTRPTPSTGAAGGGGTGGGGGVGAATPTPVVVPTPAPTALISGLVGTVLGLLAPSATPSVLIKLP